MTDVEQCWEFRNEHRWFLFHYPLLLETLGLAHILFPNSWLHFFRSFQRSRFCSGLCNRMKNTILIKVFKESIFKLQTIWLHIPYVSFPNVHDLCWKRTSKSVRPLPSWGLCLCLGQAPLASRTRATVVLSRHELRIPEVVNTLRVSACLAVKHSPSGTPEKWHHLPRS